MEQQLLKQGFQRIKKEDISKLGKYYGEMKDSYASSLSLLSIFSWDKNLPAYYKEQGGYLWFLVYDKINLRWVSLPPIGDYEQKDLEDFLSKMEEVMKKLGIPVIFTDVTPWMTTYFQNYFGEKAEIIDEEQLREYIYSIEDFWDKQQQQRERYNYNYFLKKNKIVVKQLSQSLEKDCEKVLEESFCEFHTCDGCEYGCLKDTLHNALLLCDQTENYGFLIYADDTPIAYNIVSKEKNQLVFHFKKNKRGFRGINEFIHRETIEKFGKDCTRINYTEDMGVEGLREYKSNLCRYTHQPKLEIRIR